MLERVELRPVERFSKIKVTHGHLAKSAIAHFYAHAHACKPIQAARVAVGIHPSAVEDVGPSSEPDGPESSGHPPPAPPQKHAGAALQVSLPASAPASPVAPARRPQPPKASPPARKAAAPAAPAAANDVDDEVLRFFMTPLPLLEQTTPAGPQVPDRASAEPPDEAGKAAAGKDSAIAPPPQAAVATTARAAVAPATKTTTKSVDDAATNERNQADDSVPLPVAPVAPAKQPQPPPQPQPQPPSSAQGPPTVAPARRWVANKQQDEKMARLSAPAKRPPPSAPPVTPSAPAQSQPPPARPPRRAVKHLRVAAKVGPSLAAVREEEEDSKGGESASVDHTVAEPENGPRENVTPEKGPKQQLLDADATGAAVSTPVATAPNPVAETSDVEATSPPLKPQPPAKAKAEWSPPGGRGLRAARLYVAAAATTKQAQRTPSPTKNLPVSAPSTSPDRAPVSPPAPGVAGMQLQIVKREAARRQQERFQPAAATNTGDKHDGVDAAMADAGGAAKAERANDDDDRSIETITVSVCEGI